MASTCGEFPTSSGSLFHWVSVLLTSLGFLYIFSKKSFHFLLSLLLHENVYVLDLCSLQSLFMAKKTKPIHTHDIVSLYSINDMTNKFHHGISFSSTGRERDMIMEQCLKYDMENMDTSGDPYALYFYIHLPIIYALRVLVLFSSFKTEFLTAVNAASHKLIQIFGGILRYF